MFIGPGSCSWCVIDVLISTSTPRPRYQILNKQALSQAPNNAKLSLEDIERWKNPTSRSPGSLPSRGQIESWKLNQHRYVLIGILLLTAYHTIVQIHTKTHTKEGNNRMTRCLSLFKTNSHNIRMPKCPQAHSRNSQLGSTMRYTRSLYSWSDFWWWKQNEIYTC